MIRVSLRGAEVLFSGREGGVSAPPYDSLNIGRSTDDDAADVERNLEILATVAGLDGLQLLKQVHGTEIFDADAMGNDFPEADAATTTRRGVGLLATGADCPPVALASADRVAVIHGGWRPVAAGLIEKTAAIFGEEPFDAAIGPGICQDHFEVGQEVLDAFGEDGGTYSSGRQLDLRGIIAARLRQNGAASVDDVDRCTYCDPEHFFSHRRDAGLTGRQAGIVWRA